MKKIPLFKPYIGKEEVRAVSQTLLSGWITLGPQTEAFEKAFAGYVKSKYAVALNSATSGLHLALLVAGIKEGDEVITTPLTFASTAEAVLYVGAVPVFADIDPRTLNIDPLSIEKRITKKTKAIIPVHYGGQPCDMDAINKLASKHNLVVIEDAAHAAGSAYKGKKIGGGKNMTVFSFHAVKNLTTGDGGMITTSNASLDKKLRALRWMGINKSTRERETSAGYRWDYEIRDGGFKYHMNDIAASIGLVQLRKLDLMNEKRRKIAGIYNAAFEGVPHIRPLAQLPNLVNAQHNYCVILSNKALSREEIISALVKEGISTGVHYKPLYHHPRYGKYGKAKDTPVAEEIWTRILLLPCHPGMTAADAQKVARELLALKM